MRDSFSLECIGLMGAPSLPEIVDEILEGISPLVRVDRQRLASNTRGDLVNLLVLKGFPQVVRNVEHDTLVRVWVATRIFSQFWLVLW